jgi:hypothetical protein
MVPERWGSMSSAASGSAAPPWVISTRSLTHAVGIKLAQERAARQALETKVEDLERRLTELEQRPRLRAIE